MKMARSTPKASFRSLTTGARQCTVDEAFEIMRCEAERASSFRPPHDRDVRGLERGREQDHALRPGLQVRLDLGAAAAAGGRLEDRVDAELAPGRNGGLALSGDERDPPAGDGRGSRSFAETSSGKRPRSVSKRRR